MSTTMNPRPAVSAPDIEDTDQRIARPGIPSVAAWLLLLGTLTSLIGFAWDLNWHSDVGPDTFFTIPHLFIYAGSAIVGLVCLVSSLRILNGQRRVGNALSLAPIPKPFLIAGFGTVLFLASGLWDEAWHATYGFDVTIISPPHIGLLTSIQIGMIGAITAFASPLYTPRRSVRAERSDRNPRVSGLTLRTIGVAASLSISATFLVFFAGLTTFLPPLGDVDAGGIYASTVLLAGVVAASAITRFRFAGTLVALIIIGFKLAFGWFTVAATDWYAGTLGLFIRDEVLAGGDRVSSFASQLPLAILAAGIAVDLLVRYGARLLPALGADASAKIVLSVSGAIGAVMVGAFFYLGTPVFAEFAAPVSMGTLIGLAFVGAFVAPVAWQLGNLARSVR